MNKKRKRKPGTMAARARKMAQKEGAKKLWDKESWVFRVKDIPEDFKAFVDSEVWPLLKDLHTGYKIPAKKGMAYQCLNQLIKTGLVGQVVADSRNASDKEASKRIKIWDALEKVRLCRVCKGSEQSGKTTRYEATPKLLKLSIAMPHLQRLPGRCRTLPSLSVRRRFAISFEVI